MMEDEVAANVTSFKPGNRFWERRAKNGPDYLYEGEEGAAQLLAEGHAYLEWCENNPLYETKAFAFQGDVTTEDLPRMRAATIGGFCLHLGIVPTTWMDWRARPDLCKVVGAIENAIREYKFAGAAADLLNANIISRDLGLADKQELTGPGGGPVQTINGEMSAKEAADLYAQTRDAGKR